MYYLNLIDNLDRDMPYGGVLLQSNNMALLQGVADRLNATEPEESTNYYVVAKEPNTNKVIRNVIGDSLYDLRRLYGKYVNAIIVYSQESYTKPYTEMERSYIVHFEQWGLDPSKMGNSIMGDCLDGEDRAIRLDAYDWKIESIYII